MCDKMGKIIKSAFLLNIVFSLIVVEASSPLAMLMEENTTLCRQLAQGAENFSSLQGRYSALLAASQRAESNTPSVLDGSSDAANPFACPPIAPLFDRRIEEAVAVRLEEQAASFNEERQRMTAQHERAMASLRSELQRASAAVNERLQGFLCDAQTRADGLNTEVRRLQVQAALVPDLQRQVDGIPGLNQEMNRLQHDLAQRDATIERLQAQAALVPDLQRQVEGIPGLNQGIARLQVQAALAPDLQRQVDGIPGLHAQIRQLQADLQAARRVRPAAPVPPVAGQQVVPPLGQQPAPIRVVPPAAVPPQQQPLLQREEPALVVPTPVRKNIIPGL